MAIASAISKRKRGGTSTSTLDVDSFVVFTAGLSGLVLAGSLIALPTRLLPAWLVGSGIIVAGGEATATVHPRPPQARHGASTEPATS